jgi:hypothetical protein
MSTAFVLTTAAAASVTGCKNLEPKSNNGELGKRNNGEFGKRNNGEHGKKLSSNDSCKLGGKRNTDGWKSNMSELRLSTTLG